MGKLYKMYKIDKICNLSKMYNLSILCDAFPMQTVSATHAKQNFAAMLDAAQRGPIRIRRHDRDVAILVSPEDFERIQSRRWEQFDRLAAQASEQAQANGLTEDALQAILANA